jgi:sulfofructose kinase
MHSYDVVGFGIATIDHFGVVDSFPMEDTKQALVDYAQQGGGTVATPLVACSRLGLSTAYLGRMGVDPVSESIISDFEREGVATAHLIHDAEYEPSLAMILVNPANNSRTIAWYSRSSTPIDPAHLDRDVIEASRVLYLDAHEGPASLQAAQWARDAGRLVIVDGDNYTDDIRPVLPYANVIIGSERFARQYTGVNDKVDPERAAVRLFEDFGGVCGITAGIEGSFMVTPDGVFHQPAFSVDVIDTTGAGDVFHGAFVLGLLNGWSTRETTVFSSAVAAMKCRKLGGRTGIPSLAEAVEFLHERGVDGPWQKS